MFFIKIKWPHFNLLFKDVNLISRKIKKNSTVLNLEKISLYGNEAYSLHILKNVNIFQLIVLMKD